MGVRLRDFFYWRISRINDQNCARGEGKKKKSQDEKQPCILVKGLVKTCISVKLPARKIESISVSIKLHCARALADTKWQSSVNFTGASIICNRLGSDFLLSYYFGKLPLRSTRLRTTVFSIYSIYYRLKIEEHDLGFKPVALALWESASGFLLSSWNVPFFNIAKG